MQWSFLSCIAVACSIEGVVSSSIVIWHIFATPWCAVRLVFYAFVFKGHYATYLDYIMILRINVRVNCDSWPVIVSYDALIIISQSVVHERLRFFMIYILPQIQSCRRRWCGVVYGTSSLSELVMDVVVNISLVQHGGCHC